MRPVVCNFRRRSVFSKQELKTESGTTQSETVKIRYTVKDTVNMPVNPVKKLNKVNYVLIWTWLSLVYCVLGVYSVDKFDEFRW